VAGTNETERKRFSGDVFTRKIASTMLFDPTIYLDAALGSEIATLEVASDRRNA